MDPDPHLDHARLAAAVKTRRQALGLSIKKAARLAPMSPITWTRVEEALRVRELTYAGVDRVLGWEQNTAATILYGDALSPARYPDNPVLQHLWDVPDPELSDEQRLSLVQLYLALKRTADRPQSDKVSHGHVTRIGHAV
ncbi:helix-turn-helix domain-containing protein [Nonomuraea sp. NPDC052265]|uniref:helix-turn-helix domain-containing protein n=1 Tax=Nonomuraea sp. NPDC052265 TaxID=3364374 RepID=UPI0037CBF772